MYIALWERDGNVVLFEQGVYFIPQFAFDPWVPKTVIGEKIKGKHEGRIPKILK